MFQNGFFGGAANRLYYSCFYAVLALLAKDDILVSTHNGVRTEFFKRYIKTRILSKEFSSLYSNLMGKRHESDYGDFHAFSKKELSPLLEETQTFLDKIRNLVHS